MMKITIASLAFLFAPAVYAQEARPPLSQTETSGDEIIVTGTRDQKEAIHDFIENVTIETDGQIAKFSNDICPASFGLPDAYNAVIVDRIRDVAHAAGIAVGERDCEPNLGVIVVSQAADFVTGLRKETRMLFNGLELSEIRELMKTEGPVLSWHVVDMRGSDGRRPERVMFIQIAGKLVYVPNGRILRGVIPSRIQKATRQDLALAFVVFDLEAVEGLTLTQIADHAAMRTLAKTSPGAGKGRSILALFEDIGSGTTPVDALTGWDRAYLKALYATNNSVSASHQQSNMGRIVAQELDEAEVP